MFVKIYAVVENQEHHLCNIFGIDDAGTIISCNDWIDKLPEGINVEDVAELRIKIIKNIESKEPIICSDINGINRYYIMKDGSHPILHREDGPACEYANGNKSWYMNGLLHREDGPAVEYANGSKEWYMNGLLHREDGPACEYANGNKSWYINGKLKKIETLEFK